MSNNDFDFSEFLEKSPQPTKIKTIGKFVFSFQPTDQFWASLDPSGNLIKTYFQFGQLVSKRADDNMKLYFLIIYKWSFGVGRNL